MGFFPIYNTIVFICITIASFSHAFLPTLPTTNSLITTTITPTLLTAQKRKGRKAKRDSGGKPVDPFDVNYDSAATAKQNNWQPIPSISSMEDLPQDENEVKVFDTMAAVLVDKGTNPNGAVSILNVQGKTYCFASGCPSCKIPLLKAKVLPPNEETNNVDPRLSCNFCRASFNVRTGNRVVDSESPGLVGGLVKGLFSKQDKELLPVYALGEKNGQVLINLLM